MTDHSQEQVSHLFGKSIKDIDKLDRNWGRYPAFVAIRWGFAVVKNDTLVATAKWADRLNYNSYGERFQR